MTSGNEMLREEKACNQYGASIGRGYNHQQTDGRVRLFRVRLDSGGYDPGGAYWGLGGPLYCADGDDFREYLRASDREDARAQLLEKFPDLKFFR
jgi:hypothetical protein